MALLTCYHGLLYVACYAFLLWTIFFLNNSRITVYTVYELKSSLFIKYCRVFILFSILNVEETFFVFSFNVTTYQFNNIWEVRKYFLYKKCWEF